MYNAAFLKGLMRAILERGIETSPDGIDHKHHEGDPDAPRCPIKLNLCTADLRPKARMTKDDMLVLVQGLYGYIEHRRLQVPAIGGVPNVGERLALMLQEYARTEYGRYIPYVGATKIVHPDGRREIGPVIPSAEYPSGDLWLIDDLMNWGKSKREACARYKEAGYRIIELLVVADYGICTSQVTLELGFGVHSLVSVESILFLGADEQKLTAKIIAGTRAYMAASRARNCAA